MIPWDPAKLHAHFAELPGSEQIASPFALAGLAVWLDRRQPRIVLDVGCGIGTTTALIGRWGATQIVAVEDDPWCLAQARRNLRGVWAEILWYDKVPSAYMSFPFVVLDGPQIRLEDWCCLEDRAVVFVEGGRRGQRAHLEAWLRAERRAFCHAEWKPKDRTKGFHVYVTEPTRWERAWFATVRLREGWRDLRARLRGIPVGKRRRG
jgi:SAM-dependent methyltransferase